MAKNSYETDESRNSQNNGQHGTGSSQNNSQNGTGKNGSKNCSGSSNR